MKKQIFSFVAGFLCACMLLVILSALFVTGQIGGSLRNDLVGILSGREEPEQQMDVEQTGYTEEDQKSKNKDIRTYTGLDPIECFNKPDASSEVVYTLFSGSQIECLGEKGENGGFLEFSNGSGRMYVPAEKFVKGKAYVKYNGAVDLREYLPGAQFHIDFATGENITGECLYPTIPLMEEKTAFRLLQAYKIFKSDGYIIKVCDAYRPMSAQKALYNVVQNNAFIANPSGGGSWHNRGRAVDMTLVRSSSGKEVEMPTGMHTFDYSAARGSASKWTKEARENVEYMTSVMESVGFSTISSEWWHFEYKGDGGYMDANLDYDSLKYIVKN